MREADSLYAKNPLVRNPPRVSETWEQAGCNESLA